MQTTKQKDRFTLHWRVLSKRETNVLKGVFILLILLHNFFHVFPGWAIENEFVFERSRFDFFRNSIRGSGFLDAVGLLFSYFGHYGVQIFIFLSAYGLSRSYRNKEIKYWQFLKNRLSKIYPTFFLAVLLYLAIVIVSTKSFNHPDLYLRSLLRLSFLSNLVPGESLRLVGPWWFYSMIVQFYLVFPLLRRLFDKYGAPPLIVLSLFGFVLKLLFNNTLEQEGLLINTTVLGFLPIFAFGIILAKENKILMPWWPFAIALLLFYFGNFSQLGWVFIPISFVVVMLYAYVFLKRFFHSKTIALARLFLFIGGISMYIYAVNGFLRHPFVHAVLKTNSIYFKLLLTFCFVLFVVVVALLLRATERFYFRITSRGNKGDKLQPLK